jgi:hypothetical protein
MNTRDDISQLLRQASAGDWRRAIGCFRSFTTNYAFSRVRRYKT